ncbi:serine hydrolase domain-containing protein [Curvibacter sp. APW13]|uniref:serine hydrolase domain-containing protein n=1 Tax=Curvibacter sp. APW13 TaxID=3077236 RepID=UPI0028DDCC29|nr:serine hydrolase domain-containing protein [Curvibacter sp. APW13]MDT8990530.1 serine hydrolase domain-containing protein [Curvibacter sp. APW13]
MPDPDHVVPAPLQGHCHPHFAGVARQFARSFVDGEEIGAALCVYHRGECVVDLWGGWADREQRVPWQADTLIVVFSVTKGLAAMALNLAAERGAFDWDAPVARYWPGFAQNGKADITVRQLFNHRAGLHALSTPLTLEQCFDATQRDAVRAALERQAPAWNAGVDQGYHALTFGLYASAFFRQAVGEPLEAFLHREYLDPLGADVHLGTPPYEDARIATLYPGSDAARVGRMVWAALRGGSTESNVARSFLAGQDAKGAFSNPPAPGGFGVYNQPPVRRAALAWASATASARGLARAYVPWSVGGTWQGRQWLQPQTIAPLLERQGWAEPDRVLGKPLGWSQGFLKEETTVFSPNPESFGHSGIGGTLGWCDPKAQLAIGYVMNRSDWRVRSPRALALCRALYQCTLD